MVTVNQRQTSEEELLLRENNVCEYQGEIEDAAQDVIATLASLATAHLRVAIGDAAAEAKAEVGRVESSPLRRTDVVKDMYVDVAHHVLSLPMVESETFDFFVLRVVVVQGSSTVCCF